MKISFNELTPSSGGSEISAEPIPSLHVVKYLISINLLVLIKELH